MPPRSIPEPWMSFLTEIDGQVGGEVELHCLGGFVMTMLYGLVRPTADVDVIMIAPGGMIEYLLQLAGKAPSSTASTASIWTSSRSRRCPKIMTRGWRRYCPERSNTFDYSPWIRMTLHPPSWSATSSAIGTTLSISPARFPSTLTY